MKNNKISAYKLCKFCKIPQSSFSRMIRDQWDWKVEYLIKIADFFSVSLEYLVFGEIQRSYKKLLEDYKALHVEVNTLRRELRKLFDIEDILIRDEAKKTKIRQARLNKNRAVIYTPVVIGKKKAPRR